MEIHIYCDEKEYSCNYSSWDKFRMATITATFKYIKSYITLTELSEYDKVYANKLLDIIDKIESEPNLDINIFVNYCEQSPFIDTLVFLIFQVSMLFVINQIVKDIIVWEILMIFVNFLN